MAEWKKILVEGDAAELSATDSSDIESVGTVEAAGTASTAARIDHIHDIGVGAIDSSDLFANGVVDSAAIGANEVGTSEITTGAVTNTELASNAVSTVKITDSAVTTAKISDSSVTTAKLSIDDDVDFNAESALDFGVETVSSHTSSEATSSEFVGRIIFSNANSRPYIYI